LAHCQYSRKNSIGSTGSAVGLAFSNSQSPLTLWAIKPGLPHAADGAAAWTLIWAQLSFGYGQIF
jgi:hypothetical protein